MALTIEERVAKLEEDAKHFRLTLEVHEKASDRRFSETKEDVRKLQNLATSIERLATNMEHMQESQTEILKRLDAIEKAPAEDARYYKRTAIACVITGILSVVVTAVITIVAQL